MYMVGVIAGLLLAALAGGGRLSVKGVIAGLLLAVVTAAPVYAQDMKTPEGAAAAPVSSGLEVGETDVCPHCGRDVAMGRHGQAGRTAVCPNCGNDLCAQDEAEKVFCAGTDAGFFSKYVSRGVTLSDDPVFQPDVWASYRGFTLSLWGNMDLTDFNDNEGEFNELDITLDYSTQWGMVNLSGGGIYYTFPNTGGRDTAELYAAAGLDVLLEPTVTVFYDFLEADGVYCTFGISHGTELPVTTETVSVSLELSAQIGWGSSNFNNFNAGTGKDAFTDVFLTAGLPVSIGKYFTVSPTVSYSSALDRAIRKNNSTNNQVIWGVTLSASL